MGEDRATAEESVREVDDENIENCRECASAENDMTGLKMCLYENEGNSAMHGYLP